MKAISYPLILLVTLFSSHHVFSQSIKFEKLTANDGLFSNRIFKAYRDHKGYLWLAGINGVARYDGAQVLNFEQNNEASEHFIKGVRFYDIIEDELNNIWVAGDSGVHRYNRIKDTFEHIAIGKIPNARFLELFNDSIIEVSSVSGVNYHLNIRSYAVKELSENALTTAIVTDHLGTKWKSNSKGQIICNNTDTIIDLNRSIIDFCFTPIGDLYIGTHKGLIVISQSEISNLNIKNTSQPAYVKGLTNNSITALEYFNGGIWVGTRHGLNSLKLNSDGSLKKVNHYYDLPEDYSLLNNQINELAVDKEGILWICTYGGLNKYDPSHQWFNGLKWNPNNNNSLHTNNIFQIHGDVDNNIWFGSYEKGLSKYDAGKHQFSNINLATGKNIRNVQHIYTDTEKQLWIIADNKLLYETEEGLKKANILGLNEPDNYSLKLSSFIQHPDKTYWMGINGKVVQLHKTQNNNFKVIKEWGNNIPVLRLYVDEYHRIWAGTNGKGIILIGPNTSNNILVFNPTSHACLKSNTFPIINQDTYGDLWLGSSNGLYKVTNDSLFKDHPEKISFEGFFEKDGLTISYISGILPDKDGILWLSTWKGIMKYDPSNTNIGRFIPYTFSDGLVDEKYNRGGMFKDEKTNTFYFGSANGVTFFNPVKPSKEEDNSTVLVSQVELNGDPVPLQIDSVPSSIALAKKNGTIDHLAVRFGSSSLSSPLKQVFAWKLERRDDEWTYTRQRQLILKDIPPGQYTLKIAAVSKNGIKGTPTIITVESTSNYQIVLGVGFLMILSIGIGIWIKRVKNARTQIEKKENKYEFSKLSNDKSETIAKRLNAIIQNEKPYLQADLTADKLAKLVNIKQGELSQLLNEHLNTSFYEYINKYRVEEFIRLLETPLAEKLTLISLAEQCGFSSKSTFYRAFKNKMGMTPAQYAKTLKN